MANNANKQFHLPVSRVKTIMKSSPQVENVTNESIHLMTKATELFIQYLAQESLLYSKNIQELRYRDVAELVDRDHKLEFLRELIPQKITFREYKNILNKKNVKKQNESELI